MKITKKSLSFDIEPNSGISDTDHFWNEVNAGNWEPETFDVLHQYLSKEHSYLDIGAWVGPTVLFGAQLAKKVYAFEPDPTAFAALQKNMSLNPSITNVDAYPIAVSATTGTAQIGAKISRGDSMSSLIWDKSSNDSWTTECITLADCLSRFNITDCNFIKMDIEGGESIVLPAAKEVFKSLKPTFYLSLHTPWFPNKKEYFYKVNEVLSGYKHIYDARGKKIALSDLPNLVGFQAIVATDL